MKRANSRSGMFVRVWIPFAKRQSFIAYHTFGYGGIGDPKSLLFDAERKDYAFWNFRLCLVIRQNLIPTGAK